MQTTDHIRPFFWLEEDLHQDAIASRVEEIVEQCWINLAKSKNGGYEPVPLAVGTHIDGVTGQKVVSNGKEVKILCVGPVIVPVGHLMYKEGHHAYVLRYPDHSFVRFKRIESRGVQTLTLPDDIAADLARKGKFSVLEWDTEEGRRKFEESLQPKRETVAEREEREHIEQTRGTPRKVVVPY